MKTGTVPVNVRETEQHYEMDVVAPGCSKEDFRINVENGLLTISYTQSSEQEQQDQQAGWVRNEFLQRSFSRSFTLDDTIDMDNINASYTDGVLRLTVPKNEKAKKLSRSIEVR